LICKAEAERAAQLRALILADKARVDTLACAEQLQREFSLPDALLAAGFVRNCYWDHLHGFAPSPLNDVDLIYFDCIKLDNDFELHLQKRLRVLSPEVNWQVKNQARMQLCHADPPYRDSVHAMSFWPECETAIGVRLHGSREIVSPFSLSSLFAGEVTPGPHRDRSLCEQRLDKKGWLKRWPSLRLV